jgi:type IV secretion system protein VirB9
VGSGPNATVNAIVKPRDTGLTTSVLITTDRRSYTIQLKSARHEWMPFISFTYPDEVDRAWEGYKAAQAKRVYATTLPTGENIASLDFGFRMSGDSPKWKPKRIYANVALGKVFIQFPSSAFVGEVPALVALGKDGGWFSEPSEQIVNYRRDGDLFVVDGIPEKMMLISGVGREQTSVTIDRVEEE